jgi:hypothetical protein
VPHQLHQLGGHQPRRPPHAERAAEVVGRGVLLLLSR